MEQSKTGATGSGEAFTTRVPLNQTAEASGVLLFAMRMDSRRQDSRNVAEDS
ncbi:MAG TPA: hypothetical protein VNU02_20820 [Candidatus Dormibacteraeota bacterium]|jgi:hypothetical protein|nr:hypothetical protein [Candidatus Dormibacteraeota bacterium]